MSKYSHFRSAGDRFHVKRVLFLIIFGDNLRAIYRLGDEWKGKVLSQATRGHFRNNVIVAIIRAEYVLKGKSRELRTDLYCNDPTKNPGKETSAASA